MPVKVGSIALKEIIISFFLSFLIFNFSRIIGVFPRKRFNERKRVGIIREKISLSMIRYIDIHIYIYSIYTIVTRIEAIISLIDELNEIIGSIVRAYRQVCHPRDVIQ